MIATATAKAAKGVRRSAAFSIKDIPECEIGFSTCHATNTQVAWFNKRLMDQKFGDMCSDWTEAQFRRHFSYAMPGNECFEQLEFDTSRTRALKAERYGGPGIGSNGGGARVGNKGAFQIKGVGRNPLAGRSKDFWHTYGALDLPGALFEALYCEMLNRIAPIGATEVYGVILTSKRGAYWEQEDYDKAGLDGRRWGALLVRERCLRYAHFLRVAHFKPEKAHRHLLSPDVERVRSANHKLSEHFGGHNPLVQYLGTFLSNCANQFAFAKIRRLKHGTLTPSNMSFDGRWLDLTNTGFVPSGTNYTFNADQTPFFDEPNAAVTIVRDFLYTFTKYGLMDFNPDPLFDYYDEQLEAYTAYHGVTLFGLDPEPLQGHLPEGYALLLAGIEKALHRDWRLVEESTLGWVEDEPIRALVEELFLSLPMGCGLSADALSSKTLSSKTMAFFPTGTSASDIGLAFEQLLRTAYDKECNQPDISFAAFAKSKAVASLKNIHFLGFLHQSQLGKIKSVDMDTLNAAYVRQWMEDHLAVCDWLFDPACSAILYRGQGIECRYRPEDDSFVMEQDRREPQVCKSSRELMQALDTLDDEAFVIQQYNFKPGLIRLLGRLGAMEP